MKITEAESILGMEDMTYDTMAIGIAYMHALRSANSPAERKRCATARNTLERYVTSMKKSGQFGTLDKVSAAMSTACLVRDSLGKRDGDDAVRRETVPTRADDVHDDDAVGMRDNVRDDAEHSVHDAGSDRLGERRRYPRSHVRAAVWDGSGCGHGAPRFDRTYMKSHYAQARAACRPSDADNGGMSFWKAALLTLWDATPWRWFLCFWSAVIGVICDVFRLLGAVSPDAMAITIVAAGAFLVGMMDRATGLLWTRAMPASARRIEGMR